MENKGTNGYGDNLDTPLDERLSNELAPKKGATRMTDIVRHEPRGTAVPSETDEEEVPSLFSDVDISGDSVDLADLVNEDLATDIAEPEASVAPEASEELTDSELKDVADAESPMAQPSEKPELKVGSVEVADGTKATEPVEKGSAPEIEKPSTQIKQAVDGTVNMHGGEPVASKSELSKQKADRAKDIASNLQGKFKMNGNKTASAFVPVGGNPIQPRAYDGKLFLDSIPIEKLVNSSDIRSGVNTVDLQESIKKYGLLEPLHVVPFSSKHPTMEQVETTDAQGGTFKATKLRYARYLVFDGSLRLNAMMMLNYTEVPCLVDTTIPRDLLNSYVGTTNNVKPYKFSERLTLANEIRGLFTEDSLPFSEVEHLAGFETGDWYKALYIHDLRDDFPEFYDKVENNKLTIKQSYDKLQKAVNKAEKEAQEGTDGDSEEEDVLNDKGADDLTEAVALDRNQQVGNRHILDPVLRRTVESRDEGICQITGFPNEVVGYDQETHKPIYHKFADLNVLLQVDHLINVEFAPHNNVDDVNNLLLESENAHSATHAYERGRWSPTAETLKANKWVQKVVVAGNIKLKCRQAAMEALRKQNKKVYEDVTKGKLGLGRGLLKAKVDFNPFDLFDDTPYNVYKKAAKEIDEKGQTTSELAVNQWDVDDDSTSDIKQQIAQTSKQQDDGSIDDPDAEPAKGSDEDVDDRNLAKVAKMKEELAGN